MGSGLLHLTYNSPLRLSLLTFQRKIPEESHPREMASKRSEEVTNAFNKSVRTDDKSHVEEFTKEEIERALIEYSADKGFSFYDAMERRLQELKEEEAQSLSGQEKWKDRGIYFVLGIAASLVVWFIIRLLTMWLGSNTPP